MTDPHSTRVLVEEISRRAFVVRSAGVVSSFSVAGTLLSACGGSDSEDDGGTPPSNPTGTLRVANAAAPISLDPAQAAGNAEFIFLRNLHDGLLNFNADYDELEGALATEWRVSDDGLEWEFVLRSGATFHDGEPVDSTAVKTTLEYYQAADGSFGQILVPPEFREIDDSSPEVVRIILKSPYADLAVNQTVVRMISPRNIAAGAKAVGNEPVGAGPFQFVERANDGAVTLEAFEDYWSEDGPYVERLEVPVIAELSSRVSALQADDIDLTVSVPPTQLSQLEQSSDIETSSTDSWGVSYLIFSCEQPPTNDPRIRQAISHAIDAEAIISGVLRGKGEPAQSVYPPSLPGSVVPSTTYPYDPERSMELVADSGLPTPVQLEMATPPEDETIAQAIVGQLSDAGFDAKLTTLESGVYSKQLSAGGRRQFHLWKNQNYWLTGGPLFFTIGLFPVLAQYQDPRIDKLTAELVETPSGPERDAVLADLQNLYAEENFYSPILTISSDDAFRSDVEGYETPKDGLMPTFGASFLA
jgi:peptide/nickel transport system substrate-binding protein